MKKLLPILFLVCSFSLSTFGQQYDAAKLKATPKSDAYMQGFYWNVPPGGIWWDSLAKLAPRLAAAGFSGIWYPSPAKGAAGGYSMGYDPYDHFDFGEFDQKGGVETRFGSRQELLNSINTFHSVGISVFADAVMRHMNGAEQKAPYECKPYPSHPDSSWLVFQYPNGSGRFRKTQADFIPNYTTCDVTPPYHGPDDPIYKFGEWLCHDKQSVKDSLIVWGQYMRNVLGFDGFRLDAVKHINPQFMGEWLSAANPGGFAVAEHYSSTSEIGTWLHFCQNVYGGDVSMFDFPLRFKLQEMCNATDGSFWMTNLDGAGLINNGISGFDVSTFVENHDLDRTQYDGTYDVGHNPILTNKDMAYAYIMFSEGRPCVWFRDYFAYGLAGKIDTLNWIRTNYLWGGTTKRDNLGPWYVGSAASQEDQSHDIYVAKRNGGNGRPGVYLVINDHPTEWRGVWVNSDSNKVYRDFIGRAIDKTSSNDGRVELWAPPRGYAIYVPDTTQSINHPPYIQTIEDQTAYINTLYSFQTNAADPNNQTINYALSGNPSWLSVTSGGVLTGTPTSSDTGTTTVILTVTDPLSQTASDTFSIYVSNHPMMDGVFEGTGVWNSAFVTADTAAGWAGAKAEEVYVTEDENYFYFGAKVTANTQMHWAFLLMSKYGGGSSESWGRNIVYAHRDLPDYILRGHFQSYAELHSRDLNWWNGVGTQINSSEWGENISEDSLLQEGWVEGRVLKSVMGNPSGFAVQFFLTGNSDANATFDACPDDSNTTAASGVQTRLRRYAKYGTVNISFENLQWPPNAYISLGGSVTTYGRIYAFEVTDTVGQGSGINAWVGYDTTNSNPSMWTNWVPATYNVDYGSTDEYMASIGSTLAKRIYYYAYRYQKGGGDYLYGGYSTNGGGTWNGTTNVSGVLYVAMPPLAPTLSSPAQGAINIPTTTTFSWTSIGTATHYRLQVSLDSLFGSFAVNDSTITSTSKSVSGLSSLTKYYWRVIAKNSSGWGESSETRNFTTVLPPPAVPTLSSPMNNSVNQSVIITLVWNASSGATSYRITVSRDTNFTQVVFDDTVFTTSQAMSSLLNYTNYFWRVRAFNAGGASANTTAWKFRTIVAAPAVPSLVSPTQGATNQFTSLKLIWNKSSLAETYWLQVASDTNFISIVYSDSTLADSSKSISGLNSSTKYFWKVRAKNVGGTSAFSSTRSFTTAQQVTTQFTLYDGWSLVSLPYIMNQTTKSALFPTATSSAFTYESGSGYSAEDTLQNGLGYWLKYADTTQVSLTGIVQVSDTFDVAAGWNLIGSISGSVSISSIDQIPDSNVTTSYFKFELGSGYSASSTIEPMKAYWVKMKSAGKLVLTTTLEALNRIRPSKK
jgi:alpha-amylase